MINECLLKRVLTHGQCTWSRRQCSAFTWCPLAAAFNTAKSSVRTETKSQPNGNHNATGLFDVPELHSPEGFQILTKTATAQMDELIREATNSHRTRKMVAIFDDLSDSLCKVADLAEFIRISHPSRSYSNAAENACVKASGLVERLNTHLELYKALNFVVKNGDKVSTNELDDHVANLFLKDFEQSGIHLPEQLRNQVVSLNSNILQLGQLFSYLASQPQSIRKELIPDEVRLLFNPSGDVVQFADLYIDSSHPLAREVTYKVYLQFNQEQENVLLRMLDGRHNLAQTCGFATYAHRSLKGSTADTPETVMEFLNYLSAGLDASAHKDFSVMANMKKRESGSCCGPLSIWDVPYFTQMAKKKHFQVNNSEYAAYFSLGACMQGLSNLLNRLYGIELVLSEMKPGEYWTSDIYKLAVTHETEGVLGYIYCDFFERPRKPNQDCHFTIRGGRDLPDGSYQQPVVVVMLNLAAPGFSRPSLLTPQMVDNFFHEMGHAMHSMLARTRYQHVTGTRCCTDFAEVPSILMEYFANDIRVLRTFARHFQTMEPMPESMLQQLCASKKLFTASETQMQVFYSALDQIFHGPFPLNGAPLDVLAATQSQYYGLPYVQGTAWHLKFTHLTGYGAKYYSYLVSRALASWIWTTYFDADPFSRTQGERYRRECLAHGGGKPPQKLIADFLQREPSAKTLANALLKEIDENQQQLATIL